MYDIVLKNGLVINPEDKIMSVLNLGIIGNKISRITSEEICGLKEYDCEGLVVSPGFVDAHAHEDSYDEQEGKFKLDITLSMLKMGVTTILGGQCGIGPKDLCQYMDALDQKGHPVNVAMLSAHGPLRNNQGDYDNYKAVDAKIVDAMKIQLERELGQGSFGLSFGIRYIPGLNDQELLGLCQVVKKYNGVAAAHVRGDNEEAIDSFEEFIQIGRESDCKIHLSHIGSMAAFGQMKEVLELFDECAASGMDIAADCYPYNAFCTDIGSATFDEGFIHRYGDDYSKIEMTEGKYKAQRCTKETFLETRRDHPEYLAVAHVMKEEEVDMALKHPRTILGSDGILSNGNGHPRASGSFPRFIREYVINKEIVSLYTAIEKMTYQTARRFDIPKGSLSIGKDADITVFDLESIRDTATFSNPVSNPEGIKYVFIRGELAVRDGEILRKDLGKSVRKLT
ncbi:MAG: amidohydrolase family protein [Tissierellia bacterium]|nr:amidohydrolase family protein [Tissierellia bacterium]